MTAWRNTEPGTLVHTDASDVISITMARDFGYNLNIRDAALWHGTLDAAKQSGDKKVAEMREMGLL